MTASQVSLDDLKTALRLDDKTITEWMAEHRNPAGRKIDPSNVYKALKYGSPEWLVDEITAKVNESRQTYPEYYARQEQV